MQAAAPSDGPVFGTEDVKILSASKSEAAYTKFLLAMALFFLASTIAARATEGGSCHWPWLIMAVLTGFFSVAGGYAVSLAFYENGVQRPDSRVGAVHALCWLGMLGWLPGQ